MRSIVLTLGIGVASFALAGAAAANECGQYGAQRLADAWNWHYPRETNIRTGNRRLMCNNGRTGWLYTSDQHPGQYFVADDRWARKTGMQTMPCVAVAQYCAQ